MKFKDNTDATFIDTVSPVPYKPIKTGRNLELFPHTTSTVDYNSIRNAVRFYSTNIFSMSGAVGRMYFKEFFLLYWEGDYIIKQSQDKQGKLHRNGKEYEIIYKHPVSRGMILRRKNDQFTLSFRQPFDDYKLPNVVMISIPRGSNSNV